MLKKNITYTNPFTDQEVTEEHYFHISKADLVEMEMEEHGTSYEKDGQTLGGMQAKIQRIIDSEDGKAIMAELKAMIHRSYGKKLGDRFVKSDEIWQEFSSSEAFSQLLFELCTNAEAASQFMTGIVPNNLEQVAAEVAATANGTSTPIEAIGPDPTALETEDETRTLTRAEMVEMDSDELMSGLATGRYKLS